MASKLLEVPAEILACIADGLEIEHYSNLRLASRQMDEYTFPHFAKKFFSRRKFFRNHLSLSALLAISESRLGPYLETLVLGTELLEVNVPSEAPRVSRERYAKAFADQTSMVGSGWDRDTLAGALRSLPGLKGVSVESFDDREVWDFDSNVPISVIDGGYGLKTLLRDLGYEDGRPPSQASTILQWVAAVQILLGTVAMVGARPKALTITGKMNNGGYMSSDGLGVDDDAFNIPSFMEETMLPVIEGLEELDLEVHNRVIYPVPDDPACCRTCHLRRFLGLPKNLQKLRIARLTGDMQPLTNTEEKDGFWAWMASSAKGKGKAISSGSTDEAEDDDEDSDASQTHQWNMTPISATNPLTSPPPISLPHLRELHLAEQDILPRNLTKLLKKVAPTLVKLDLHDILLRDRRAGADEDPAPEDNNDDDDGGTVLERVECGRWIALCEQLAAMPIDELREVNISGFGGLGSWHCSHFGDGTAPGAVYFRALKIVGEDCYDAKAEFSYKGPDVRGALGLLVADLRAALRDGRHVFVSEPGKRRSSF
ncbi:hypothetical protein Daus18300_011891 [Diaporthe australafricana]|uniref:F-box domain-containing protein n=1 Tax=Diaporthe australafricana TaxID=127596 RepID=A0ABR3W4Q0_9PEZI